MPDCKGCINLQDFLLLPKHAIDPSQFITWALQLCVGMQHANRHGIRAHGDIKPSNILIGSDGKPKITDFGGVRAGSTTVKPDSAGFEFCLNQLGSSRSILVAGSCALQGTPGYIPPEVYWGEEVDVRSDIYNLGLVIWQMITGSVTAPFIESALDDSPRALERTYRKQMRGKVPDVDGPIKSIIERCLAPEPEDRFSDFDQLRIALQALKSEDSDCGIRAVKVS